MSIEVPDDILDKIADLMGRSTTGPWRACRACTENKGGCNLVWAESNPEVPLAGGDEVCATWVDAQLIALLREYGGWMVREIKDARAGEDARRLANATGEK